MATGKRKETEYPLSWRNMIDAQFEEQHTEIGLEAFANFITPGFAPSIPELLILCHLALQDATWSSTSAVERSLLPSTSASLPLPHTALNLLRRLLAANTPAMLARAMPNCNPRLEQWHDLGELSLLEREGRKMMRWHDFWEGLERCGGSKQKVRQGAEPPTREEDARAQDRWWALADWAVDLWQKDLEAVWAWRGPATDNNGAPIPLLLAQIPPTNAADPLAQRWELHRPIMVFLAAFANMPPLRAPDAESEALDFLVLPRSADELARAQWERRRHVALRLLDLLLALATPTIAHPRPLLSPSRLVDQLSSKLALLPTPLLLVIFPLHPSSAGSPFGQRLHPLELQLLGSILLGCPMTAPPDPVSFDTLLLSHGRKTARAAVLKLVLFQQLVNADPVGTRARGPWRNKVLKGTWVDEPGPGEGWTLVKAVAEGVASVVDG